MQFADQNDCDQDRARADSHAIHVAEVRFFSH